MSHRVVITGIGALTPLGATVADFWTNLIEGRSGIRPHPGLTVDLHVGAVDFDPSTYLSQLQVNTLDRVSQLALLAAREALANARHDFDKPLGPSCGVFFGTSMGGAGTMEHAYARFFGANSSQNGRGLTIPAAMLHAPAAQVGIRFKAQGECQTYSTACSSSTVSIGEAFRRIRDGYLESALAGGAESMLLPGVLSKWKEMRVLCKEPSDRPGTGCRPFSKDRTGFAISEGAAVLVLESLQSARCRGAEPLAEIVGYGVSNDATHITKPDSEGQVRSIRNALADARIDTEQVQHINAHGTATVVGDKIETESIKSVFGSHASRIAISATKSSHGHLMGATGAVEMAATVLALKHQIVPPTAFWQERDPDCDLDHVSGQGRPMQGLEYALSNSFAFGGNNAALLVRRWAP